MYEEWYIYEPRNQRRLSKDMTRILGPFRKRVLQSAASFPVIVTQQYPTQFLKRDY